MNQLAPDRLQELWQQGDRWEMTAEVFPAEQERRCDTYWQTWAEARRLDGHANLEESLCAEFGRHVNCNDWQELRARCRRAVDDTPSVQSSRNSPTATDRPRTAELSGQ
jgi:hypothetical protein